MRDTRLAVIIPAWNLCDTTAACLDAIADHTPRDLFEDMEVAVVDNGSTDDTPEAIPRLGKARLGDAFTYLRMPENLGFAKACNAGADGTRAPLLLFLNNDTTVTPGWLEPLLAAIDEPGIGATGPLLLHPDGTVQHCGIVFSPFMRMSHLYEDFPGTHPLATRKRSFQAITGAAILVRRKDFMACGRFHEGYVNGFEDVDLCCGLRSLGLALTVTPESCVIHHTSKTPGRFDKDKENGALFRTRHSGDLHPDLHVHAAKDGYTLKLSPSLHPWLLPHKSRLEALNARFRASFDEKACRQALEEDPLWMDGYVLLMDRLVAEGRGDAALPLGLRGHALFPDSPIQPMLLRLARQGDCPDVLKLIMDDAVSMSKPEAFPGERKGIALMARRGARETGDRALERILDEWLVTHGTGR
jgi:GT2 family glycosyltransferase